MAVFRQLQKQRLKHAAGVVVRDSLRNEVAKQQRIDEDMNAKRAQQRMDIEKLNMLINQAEEQMVSLCRLLEEEEAQGATITPVRPESGEESTGEGSSCNSSTSSDAEDE